MIRNLRYALLSAAVAATVAACGGGSSPTAGTSKATLSTGRITAFGSVFVNGVEYDTRGAAIQANGQTGLAQADLAIGQVVTVVGTRDDSGHGVAAQIVFEAEIEGPVTSVDAANNSFVALGQTVVVDAATVFSGAASIADLAVNDIVEVSGPRDASGVIHATYVEKQGAGGATTQQVKGTVASLDPVAKTFALGTLTVDYSAATLEPASLSLADGLQVEVKGALSGTVFVATKVEADVEMRAASGEDQEVEGLITSVVSPTQFVVDGITVLTSATTRYRDGTAADIAVDRRVEVEGTVDANGQLLADVVAFDGKPFVEAVGDVQAVDTAAGTLKLLGLTFATDSSTAYRIDDTPGATFSLADIRSGDHLEIGASVENGVLVAKSIERKSASTTVEFQADVSAIDAANHLVTVHGLPVSTAAAVFEGKDGATISEAQFYSLVALGDVVKAEGSFDGTQIIATAVSLESETSGN